ncbi:pyridoxal 5'-phosphate synthase glutaminase subunit PdxT [Dermatophilus congolensis]|uniref:pyridoxal 5'-phosphate synthase glutaminase subunit PdxT n=1 Tax=Dermatophilus congolensis TaxID=1863 RepID=UPI001AAF117F|nr:pyridoxal 5'-phosphate synthase glutaminase subunit PdxT [Dermatophilus congolensis]MBO3151766.1 pyridoxal 5'-phosphate synthase glutaminase subunit PdxT [Dermatophilus congolensis]MBO3161231.1 pyridoxal 5'-phosphate synthase glutaminase subunit PdxT [Dermatophilus congolensis]MBO3163048.1 pyridoxal 5'-phosphate synthase glutaminase subunit PdxT [Dermatophilus congolensis]MBO3176601.1 pyridoxal 5'-phosphate synthase glutaminase subunit PdxT [Dermatophilus congolensis]
MTSPTIGILALQGDVHEHATAITACGATAVPIRRPEELHTVHGIVLPGGESTVIDRLLRTFDLQDPLKERLRNGMPAYGSCAGMILLANSILDGEKSQQTLGGLDIVVRRNAFGRQIASFETDLPVAGITTTDTPMRAVFIRAPWVETTGPEVEILASVTTETPTGHSTPRPVVVAQGNLLASAFHPEITGDHRIHQHFINLVRAS